MQLSNSVSAKEIAKMKAFETVEVSTPPSKRRRPFTRKQREAMEAASVYAHSECFSCGLIVFARADGQEHERCTGHNVLDYYDRRFVE
jgi:hypothetical protein